MVAKDYPFYLTVKRANCSLEVPPASSPAKDAEVGTSPPGPLWVACLSVSIPSSLGSLLVSLSLCFHLSLYVFLSLHLSHYVSLSPSLPLCLLPPFRTLSVNQG